MKSLEFCFVYNDDVLITSENEKQYNVHICLAFQRLNSSGLGIFWSKNIRSLSYDTSEKL